MWPIPTPPICSRCGARLANQPDTPPAETETAHESPRVHMNQHTRIRSSGLRFLGLDIVFGVTVGCLGTIIVAPSVLFGGSFPWFLFDDSSKNKPVNHPWLFKLDDNSINHIQFIKHRVRNQEMTGLPKSNSVT